MVESWLLSKPDVFRIVENESGGNLEKVCVFCGFLVRSLAVTEQMIHVKVGFAPDAVHPACFTQSWGGRGQILCKEGDD